MKENHQRNQQQVKTNSVHSGVSKRRGFFRESQQKAMFGGILFTSCIAFIGFIAINIPWLSYVGPMATAILLAVLYRQFFGYPEPLREGVQFTAKKILRFAIVLYGIKLNIAVVWNQGLPLLGKGILVIGFSIGIAWLLAKWFHADQDITFLASIGTGVCGAAAIAAVSPIQQAKEEDTALSVGIIALTGTVFAIGYTLLLPMFPNQEVWYGIWSGISLHELAHVALAADPAGEEALAMALLTKLGRVFLLIPLCFLLILWKRREGNAGTKANIEFPWFLVGFLVMSFLQTFVIGDFLQAHKEIADGISKATTFLLTMAMVGLGLNIHLNHLKNRAAKPFFVIIITSALLSVFTYWIV